MTSALDLLALLREAEEYIVLRACCGLTPNPAHERITQLAEALSALPPADQKEEQRVRAAIAGQHRRAARLRVIDGTRTADVGDAYEQTDRTGWVTDV